MRLSEGETYVFWVTSSVKHSSGTSSSEISNSVTSVSGSVIYISKVSIRDILKPKMGLIINIIK